MVHNNIYKIITILGIFLQNVLINVVIMDIVYTPQIVYFKIF